MFVLSEGEACFQRVKIFVPGSGAASDCVQSCVESSLGYCYTVQSGFRLSVLFSREFIENFVKAGEVRVYTAVEEGCGAEHDNLVSVTASGDTYVYCCIFYGKS
jgi:hypothetical protein